MASTRKLALAALVALGALAGCSKDPAPAAQPAAPVAATAPPVASSASAPAQAAPASAAMADAISDAAFNMPAKPDLDAAEGKADFEKIAADIAK